MRRLVPVAILALLSLGIGTTSAAPVSVESVTIVGVTQLPYQPVSVRVVVVATMHHDILVGLKIFDRAGQGVYSAPAGNSSSQMSASITQPYHSTGLTLRWNKVAYDGSRLPRGQTFLVIAYASDLTTGQKLVGSSPYAFTLTT